MWVWRESNSLTHSYVSISFTNQSFLSSFFYIFPCFNCLKISYIWAHFLGHINPDCPPPASPLLTQLFSVPISCLLKKNSVCFYQPLFLKVFLIKIFIFFVLVFSKYSFWGSWFKILDTLIFAMVFTTLLNVIFNLFWLLESCFLYKEEINFIFIGN